MASETTLDRNATAEMEILEFLLGKQAFGVSVLKIEAIEQYDANRVTTIPTLPPGVMGTLLFRNRTVPLVDLGIDLGIAPPNLDNEGEETGDDATSRVFLVINFNNATVAFVADGVNRIHRVALESINPMEAIFEAGDEGKFTGSFNVEGREILIVDMEKLVGQVVPAAVSDLTSDDQIHASADKEQRRAAVRIILAEDSGTARSKITDVLAKGGYVNVMSFKNGQAAMEAVRGIKDKADRQGTPISDLLNLVITDIEMPQMDGLTLCQNIKESMGLDIPVILYSTLSNDEFRADRKTSKADAFISKPQIVKLVETVDQLTVDRA